MNNTTTPDPLAQDQTFFYNWTDTPQWTSTANLWLASRWTFSEPTVSQVCVTNVKWNVKELFFLWLIVKSDPHTSFYFTIFNFEGFNFHRFYGDVFEFRTVFRAWSRKQNKSAPNSPNLFACVRINVNIYLVFNFFSVTRCFHSLCLLCS